MVDYPVTLIALGSWTSSLSYRCVCVFSRSEMSDSLQPMDCSLPGSSVYGDSPGKNTGLGCHVLLQAIFLTQGSNPHLIYLLHCRQIFYLLSHQGSLSCR